MKLLNTTTNTIMNVVLTDNQTSSEYTQDIAAQVQGISYNCNDEIFQADGETCAWFLNYCIDYKKAHELIDDYTEDDTQERMIELGETLQMVEFNDVPKTIIDFFANIQDS